ncbi:MAG: pyridoxamine 5'-phosphate oxidase family protein [Candidatus Levybacteria bacterium]|nr:pyridoxamine 5'-phosphate oxidase family protein [Candidatus Levybacteria bacterium]
MRIEQEILDFITSQRVGVLAIEMPDGSPHAATVHFAHTDDPLIFYFETNKDYKKSEALFGKDVSRASFVIGTDEGTMKTFQTDGTAQLVKAADMEHFRSIYLGKFSEKKDKSMNPKFVAFSFAPSWWRYTNFSGPNGKVVLTSD